MSYIAKLAVGTSRERTAYFKDKDNNILHREDGPAVEWEIGHKQWFINGKLHRENGPAVISCNDLKEWWINGKRHRADGPAVEYCGDESYFLNDINYPKEEYWAIVRFGGFI